MPNISILTHYIVNMLNIIPDKHVRIVIVTMLANISI